MNPYLKTRRGIKAVWKIRSIPNTGYNAEFKKGKTLPIFGINGARLRVAVGYAKGYYNNNISVAVNAKNWTHEGINRLFDLYRYKNCQYFRENGDQDIGSEKIRCLKMHKKRGWREKAILEEKNY